MPGLRLSDLAPSAIRRHVFFRHTYYLQAPFLYGDPNASWAVDPERLKTPEAWKAFLKSQNIRWIVRDPEYPEAIAEPLVRLEQAGNLMPIAQAELSEFEGMRILGVRKMRLVVILRITEAAALSAEYPQLPESKP